MQAYPGVVGHIRLALDSCSRACMLVHLGPLVKGGYMLVAARSGS
jgi:hypothetical protein